MDEYHENLELLRKYLKYRIDVLGAVRFGFHKSPYFPDLTMPTTTWYEQILTFEEWKAYRPTKSFHMIGINYE